MTLFKTLAPLGLCLGLALGVLPALADEEEGRDSDTRAFTIASDRYIAGASPVLSGETPVGDAFLAGETVRIEAPVTGTAHLAGRRVRVSAPVGERVYAVGMDVEIAAAVTGDATLAGYSVDVTGPIGGDLRAAGSEIGVSAPVAGYALLTGEHLRLDAAIGGDAVMAVREAVFGPGARVDGRLTLYVPEPGAVSVPATVAPADRVELRQIEDFERGRFDDWGSPMPSTGQVVGGFLIGVLITGLVAAGAIGIAPDRVAAWRGLAQARPWRALVSGFLVASTLTGSMIVISLTLFGLLLVPFIVVATWLVLYAGYVLGAYVLGAGLWGLLGRTMPETFPGKFGVATLGAFVSALAWAVPFIGWLFVMGLTLMGVGALAAFAVPRDPILRRP